MLCEHLIGALTQPGVEVGFREGSLYSFSIVATSLIAKTISIYYIIVV